MKPKRPCAYITFSKKKTLQEFAIVYEIHDTATQLICGLQGRLMTAQDVKPASYHTVEDYLAECSLYTDVPIIIVTMDKLAALCQQFRLNCARVVHPDLH